MTVRPEDYLSPEIIARAKSGGHIDPKDPNVRRFNRAVNKENRDDLTVNKKYQSGVFNYKLGIEVQEPFYKKPKPG